jgi:hypothetical protein
MDERRSAAIQTNKRLRLVPAQEKRFIHKSGIVIRGWWLHLHREFGFRIFVMGDFLWRFA